MSLPPSKVPEQGRYSVIFINSLKNRKKGRECERGKEERLGEIKIGRKERRERGMDGAKKEKKE